MLNYKRQKKLVVQNVAWVPGTTLQPIALPTDLPISKILVTLAGIPVAGVTPGGTQYQQNAFGSCLANALGRFSIASASRDGSDGISLKNIPASQAYFDSYLMNRQFPQTVDSQAIVPATYMTVTVPIHFLDERLPVEQQAFTALEAARYGGANNLNLTIETGQLWQAVATPDMCATVGGTYATPPAAGTLTVTVVVEQLVPIGFEWPAWNSPGALPFIDRDFEYYVFNALNQPQSNNIQLNRRGIQAQTTFMLASQTGASLYEQGTNNLGVAPIPQLIERIGLQEQNKIDGPTLQSEDLQEFTYGAPAATFNGFAWFTGVYSVNDWRDNADFGYSLRNVQGLHSWDTNMGDTPGGAAQQILRLMHITYNPSAAARRAVPSL